MAEQKEQPVLAQRPAAAARPARGDDDDHSSASGLSTGFSLAPKFDGTDYAGYAMKMTAVLRYLDLWDVVKQPVPGVRVSRSVIGDEDSEDEVVHFGDAHTEAEDHAAHAAPIDPVLKRKSEKAFVFILSSIKDESTLSILADVPFSNSSELWRRLGAHFEKKSEASVHHLLQEFHTIKQRATEGVENYIARIKKVVLLLKQCKSPVEMSTLRYKFVDGLNSQFDQARSAIQANERFSKMSFDFLSEYMIGQECHIAARKQSSAGNGAGVTITCFKCNKVGHYVADCPQANSQAAAQSTSSPPGPHSGGKPRPNCTFCKRKGHTEDRCYSKHGFPPGFPQLGSAKGPVAPPALSMGADIIASGAVAYHSVSESVQGDRIPNLIDSGASEFLFSGGTPLKNPVDCPGSRIRVASGEVLSGPKRGLVTLKGASGLVLELKNSLTHPGLKSNLLSVYRMTQSPQVAGIWFTSEGAQVISKDGAPPTGSVLLTGRQKNGVYELDGMSIVKSDATLSALSSVITSELEQKNSALWHNRLAHLSTSGMEKLLRSGAVSGLDKVKDDGCGELCQGCIKGKAHRASFDKVPSERTKAQKPLDRVHADLTGPMQEESLGGAKYLLIIVDEFSRKTFGFCLRQKGDAASKIMEWSRAVAVLHGRPITEFHTDGGGEFLSTELLNFFKSVGTVSTITPPHTPQHNAIAERMMRTIVEPARCVLYHAGASLSLWGEAMLTVIYVRNIAGVRKDSKLTPNMLWQPKSGKLNVAHLRAPMCDAWVHVPKADRQKLDAKAVVCVFLGYNHDDHGYRLFNVATRKVIHSRDVTFDELKFTQAQSLRIGDLRASDGKVAPRSEEEYFEFIQDSRFRVESKLMEMISREAIPPVQVASPEVPIVEAVVISPVAQVPVRDPAVSDAIVAVPSPTAVAVRDAVPVSDPMVGTRRSTRTTAGIPPSKYGMVDLEDVGALLASFALKVAVESGEIPTTLKAALDGPDRAQWMQAAVGELASLIKHKTMVACALPANRRSIGCKFVFGQKLDAEGKIAVWKARIVAKGYAQREGVDYTVTFAPVLSYTTARVHFATVCELDYEMDAMDVKTAFLNAKLKEEVYITLPPGVELVNGVPTITENYKVLHPQVYLLIMSLYGLVQAPHDWNEEFNASILSRGYSRCVSDSCMYVKKSRTGRMIFLPLFVDDTFPAYHREDRAEWEEDKKAFMAMYEIKDLGEAKLILGMRITRDRVAKTLKVDQEVYINRLIKSCDMQDCIPVETPEDSSVNLSYYGRTTSSSLDKVNAARLQFEAQSLSIEMAELLKWRYGSVIGTLLYAALSTRPDISHVVSFLCRFVSCPLPKHWEAAMYVLRYLKGTAHLGLVYRQGNPKLIVSTDSNWGGDVDDQKSQTGVVSKMNGCAVSWKSQKQSVVSLSSAEAEYMAAGEGAKEALWLRQLLMEMGRTQSTSTVMLIDNKAAIALADNDVFHNRTKHIDMRHHFIRDHVKSDALLPTWISTHEQEADIFTKALSKHPFMYLRAQVMGLNQLSTAAAVNNQLQHKSVATSF